jgi:hypothetical protein
MFKLLIVKGFQVNYNLQLFDYLNGFDLAGLIV